MASNYLHSIIWLLFIAILSQLSVRAAVGHAFVKLLAKTEKRNPKEEREKRAKTVKKERKNSECKSMTKRLTYVPRMQEVSSSNSRQAKSYTALSVALRSSCLALTLRRGDGTVNSLHTLT